MGFGIGGWPFATFDPWKGEDPVLNDAQKKSIELHPNVSGFIPIVLVCHCGKSGRLDLRAKKTVGMGEKKHEVPAVTTLDVISFWAIHGKCEDPGPGRRPSSAFRG